MARNDIETPAAGTVYPIAGTNPRIPFEHQREAMKALDLMEAQHKSYSTLLVLPTGGGKTYTASTWLLRHALDKEKKILWLAHRQSLLDQAAESFQKYAYATEIPHISSFHYRIVSGAPSHDKTIHIKPTDNLLIIGKDSLGRNLERLGAWLQGENEIYVVVDEAHHSTAKTYRRVLEYVKKRVKYAKILGLTATPFRTAESEQGLLAKIYTDGISKGQSVKGDIGIAYKVDLKELINRRILSSPLLETYHTNEDYGVGMGLKAWESIQNLDKLPPEIAEELAKSGPRNQLIVNTYKNKAKKYGKTIVFTVSINHAIALTKLFKDAGIRAEYVVSDIKDMGTGATISAKDNERKLKAYRSGDVQVLVNVNILTEGIDLPMTQTVFLARPTVSTILMTQMVGRALRGEDAGGTSFAHIVAFIDNWSEHIAWVNPESIFMGEDATFKDNYTSTQRIVKLIAISKIEEFAAILNDEVDTSELEKVPFMQRIPVGMYAFQYINEQGVDFFYQVMVYDSTKRAYEKLMKELPKLFRGIDSDNEYLSEKQLKDLEEKCRKQFFSEEMIPPYDSRDVKHILQYYMQKAAEPKFYTFPKVDREKLNVAAIAQKILDMKLTRWEETEYVNKLWEDSDENILRIFFGGKKNNLLKALDIEFQKITYPELYINQSNVKAEEKDISVLSLHEIGKINAAFETELREAAFEKAKCEDGYKCMRCGKIFKTRRYLQVDHIIALNNGGRSESANLQVLCRSCNAKKSDHMEE